MREDRKMLKSDVMTIIEASNNASRKGDGAFVGAIYDSTSPSGDIPSALVVGINYGQQATSGSVVGRNEDAVGYAKHVAALAGERALHTVLWNFFPYLTDREWLNDVSNSADEAERIFDGGYADPFGAFSDLVSNLRPELVISHGVSSSVPILARVAIRRVGCSALLVQNLARGLRISSVGRIA